jgi:glycosyltransferase involved in cell wall biosynthesis
MNQHLTICYMTCRNDPKFEWFFDSLAKQSQNLGDISVVVIDFFSENRTKETLNGKSALFFGSEWTNPKPSVWQGEHRLTKENWFSASNARNTAICHSPDGWIAFVDDLSVLMPGWLNSIKQAMENDYIVFGAYRKVKKLVVENGEVKSWEPSLNEKGEDVGMDSRWRIGNDNEAVPIGGGSLFGCSLAGPVESFLQIGGFPETLCDGTGSEDCVAGIMLENNGYKFKYDRRMLTLESEELHHYSGWDESEMDKKKIVSSSFRRCDWGISPFDKSHKIIELTRNLKWHCNDLGDGFPDIRTLRNHILAGGEFPIRYTPEHEWYSRTLLRDL